MSPLENLVPPRTKAKSSSADDTQRIDPFCVEKNIHDWASSRILARGRDYYRKGKVLALETADDGGISVQVEGSQGEPYRVDIRFDHGGMPASRCSCPFRWEPLCKHAVAALIAWQQEETGSEPVLGPLPSAGEDAATDDGERERHIQEMAHIEREARRSRCVEEGLRILRTPPQKNPLGVYLVSSGNQDRKGELYQVQLRDAAWNHASCGCLDFGANELGTCKHVEAVRRYLGPEGARRLEKAVQRAERVCAYLAPRPSHLEIRSSLAEIRFFIPPRLQPRVSGRPAAALDADGYLRGAADPSEQKRLLEAFVRRLKSMRIAVDVDPSVHAMLEEEKQSLAWNRKISEIAKSPSRHAVWRDSIGRMKARLHPYQTEGILFAVGKRRAFLGDDMGLGKTMQAIGASLLLKELGQVRKVLVVTPSSLKFQWKTEIENASDASASIVSGPARSRDEQYRKPKAFFTLINYELLYRDFESIRALAPDLIILDEAQRIKNWDTKIAKILKRLESPFKLVLTGTPLENKLAELQSIAEFLHPRALGAPWNIIPSYARLDAEGKIIGYGRLDHLRERTKKFLLRRTRPEVLSQLPKRTDNNFWTPVTPEQHQVHDELARQVLRLINKWKKYKRLTREDLQRLMMLLGVMRIVSNAYGQYDWKSVELEVLTAKRASAALKKKIGSPKLEEFYRVMSDLLEVPGQKVVVFSQWERMVRLAEIYTRDLVEASGGRSVLFSGRLSLKKRDALVRNFLDDPKTRVFFSTDAGGVGLNLQRGASCVVNLEIPWNPAILEQRVGRVLRMGQKKSVQVINLISSECIEERIFNLVAQKKALFSGVFSENVKEIRFDPNQTASFIDKMRQIVPETMSVAEKTEDVAEEETSVPPPAAENVGDAIGDSVSRVVPPASENAGVVPTALPALEIDLKPVAAALSQLLPGLQKQPVDWSEGLRLRVSENESGVHFSLPKPAVEIIRGFRPLLEALLRVGA